MASPLERVLASLPDAKRYGHRYCVKCPVHEGIHKDSLSFCEVEDGKVLLRCFGGCDTAAILRALGLEWKDLFPDHTSNGHHPNLRRRRDTEAEQAERINLTLAADYILTLMVPPGPEGPPTEAMGRYIGVVEDLWVFFMQDESHESVQAHWLALHDDLVHAAPKLLAAVEQRQRGEPPADKPSMDLPAIDVANEDVPIVAEQAWDALLAANDPPVIFRQGTPIRLEHDPKTGIHAVEVNANRWRYHLARAANFVRIDAKENCEPTVPPVWLVEDMLARPDPPLPPLTRIVEVPVFAPDGTLQTTPGYHPASATFLALPKGLQIPDVPLAPTGDDVRFAKLLIGEILVDFPFASASLCHQKSSPNTPDSQYQASVAHSYALLLLPFVRDLIDDPTPIHLIEAATAGSGKGLLAHALLGVSLGYHIGVLTEAREEDEWRKRLTTLFKEVRAAVVLDNLRRSLDSGQVAAALTARMWEDRKLGTNETIRVPVRCVWCVTGNNPVLSTEIARRTIRIRLDANTDRPWLRTEFTHPDLLAWVSDNRGKLVWAALVLIRNWLALGRTVPEKLKPLGSYEQWSRVMGGILAAAEIPGFLGNLEEFYELADHEGAVLRVFVGSWWEKHQSHDVGTTELLPIAKEIDGLELHGKDDGGLRRSLGKLISKQRDRVIGTKRICMAGTTNRATRWKLIDLSPRR
jgi:putative DNA primase/helicase